jgi:hypothetical protein
MQHATMILTRSRMFLNRIHVVEKLPPNGD